MNESVLEMEHITEKGSTMNSDKLITYDDIVGHDHQGWPLYKLRVISLLRSMGISDDVIK